MGFNHDGDNFYSGGLLLFFGFPLHADFTSGSSAQHTEVSPPLL